MIVGLVKEIKNNEFRVGLTPDNVKAYVDAGHAQEAVNVDLKVSADGHVRQLCFKPAQLGLKMRHRILGVIEMAVLHEIRKEAAAHQIPGTPALGAV